MMASMHCIKPLTLIVIVIISITNTAASTDVVGSSLAVGESHPDNPKAEALTLVIHDLPTSPRLMNIPPQVKVVKERSDDIVHVYHTRPKRQRQSSRKRRPSSSSNFRSRIKSPPSSQSNFGGFKDFSSSDFRNPPRGYGEPPRATNKYKFGPQQSFEGYNYTPQQQQQGKNKKSQKRERPAAKIKNIGPPGPPQSQNHLDVQFGASQQPTNSQNYFVNHNFPPQLDSPAQSSQDDHYVRPLNDFPLEKGANYNFPKTSYGYPVRQVNSKPGITKSSQFSVLGTNLDGTPNQNFPRLPNRYEQNEFNNPSRPNPVNNNNNNNGGNPNLFLSEFNVGNSPNDRPDLSQNFPRESNRHSFKQFNKFKNFDYDYKNRFNSPSAEDDEEADYSSDYVFKAKRPVAVAPTTTTTTTTPFPFTVKHRPKKQTFGKKNRPGKVPQTHTLDTEDLRDAYGDASDFHEIHSSSAEDYKGFNTDFDSQRNTRRSQNPVNLHELPSTLKNHQNTLRSALGEDFQIVSVQKSLEKDPRDVNLGFLKKQDFFHLSPSYSNPYQREFSVGGELNFGHAQHNPAAVWPENFPKNHRLV